MSVIIGDQILAFRICMLRSGLRFEIKTGMRMSNKTPKCSTIVRREFGFKGTPARLLEQLEAWMDARGYPDPRKTKPGQMSPIPNQLT